MHLTVTETRAAGQPNALKSEMTFICDGTKFSSTFLVNGVKQSMKDVPIRPKDLNAKLAVALARESIAVPVSVLSMDLGDLQSRLKVTGFSKGGDAEHPTLSYRVGEIDAKLWYDSKTFVPRRRLLTSGPVGAIGEAYENWRLNVDLPDGEFKLPD